MPHLTDQQAAIASEGICPLCNGEITDTVIRDFWVCKACDQGFQLVPVETAQPSRYTEWMCRHCRSAQLSVHPANVSDLECGQCAHVTSLEFE